MPTATRRACCRTLRPGRRTPELTEYLREHVLQLSKLQPQVNIAPLPDPDLPPLAIPFSLRAAPTNAWMGTDEAGSYGFVGIP